LEVVIERYKITERKFSYVIERYGFERDGSQGFASTLLIKLVQKEDSIVDSMVVLRGEQKNFIKLSKMDNCDQILIVGWNFMDTRFNPNLYFNIKKFVNIFWRFTIFISFIQNKKYFKKTNLI